MCETVGAPVGRGELTCHKRSLTPIPSFLVLKTRQLVAFMIFFSRLQFSCGFSVCYLCMYLCSYLSVMFEVYLRIGFKVYDGCRWGPGLGSGAAWFGAVPWSLSLLRFLMMGSLLTTPHFLTLFN